MIIFMRHTVNWLSSIGYDMSNYFKDKEIEAKEQYLIIHEKTENN